MEMSREVQSPIDTSSKCKRPSERTALFILTIISWFKGIFTSSATVIPRGQVFQHQGNYLSAGKEIRYPRILLVEDNPSIAREFIDAIKKYYSFGSVKILVAYAYDAAVTFFYNEDIDLVIMDADLDDIDGDGVALTSKFLGERQETSILANSSSRISNMKLTGFGACESLEKSTEKLKGWLLLNDRTGSTG
jgi:CheY-like chemotaxis protein